MAVHDALPLSGIHVLELSIAIAAPSAGQVLGDYGADVIKVEPPGGDTQRHMVSGLGKSSVDPYQHSAHFYAVNRGKRSIILNLKTKAGLLALHALLEKSDVFISNYRYESLQKLGLDSESLQARHPRLVICPMTGWGFDGPAANQPVYDVSGFWARSGAAASHTDAEGYPAVLAPGFGDMATGLAAVGGICAALLAREKTGKGMALSTSLLRTGVHCNSWALSSYFAFGRVIKWGRRDGTGNPLATVYRCKDGKAFWLTGFEADRHWPNTARAVGQSGWLQDQRFSTAKARRANQGQLVAELDRVFATKTRDEWAVLFDAEGVWWAPVLTAAEVAADPQALAAGSFIETPLSSKAKAAGRTKVTMAASPVDFLNAPKTGPRRPTPELGEQTEEIINELSLDDVTRAELLAEVPLVTSCTAVQSAILLKVTHTTSPLCDLSGLAVRDVAWESRFDLMERRIEPRYAAEPVGTPRRELQDGLVRGIRVRPVQNPFVRLKPAMKYRLNTWQSRNWKEWSPNLCNVRGSRRRYRVPQDIAPYKDELGEWHPPRVSGRYKADIEKQYYLNSLPWVWANDYYQGKLHYMDREPHGLKRWYRKEYRKAQVLEALKRADEMIEDYRKERRQGKRLSWVETIVKEFAGDQLAAPYVRSQKKPKM
ncbi:fldA [Symbiodinium natans]|uniref:FldA protein n=1 Tax=Symbiodinium natans TaxID=878477 RepID=A0A812IGZ4_9DINO|nr:fldA [Symbiodinium natans]